MYGWQSIVMSVSVCLSVCLSVRANFSQIFVNIAYAMTR